MPTPASRRSVTLIATLAATASLGLSGILPASADPSPAAPGPYQATPIQVRADFRASAPAALPTPAECLSADGMACFTPTDIRSAYDIPDTIDGVPAGTGETIMIVDAYGSPTAQADLDAFSATMGMASTTLRIFEPEGAPDWSAPDNNEYGWAGETDLDVEWAHAIAPGATIDLVVGPDSSELLDESMRWGLKHLHPDTMSMSYGAAEPTWMSDRAVRSIVADDSAAYAHATRQGTTIFASSGDSWADNGLGVANFQEPADDPSVVAVGGTMLNEGLDPSLPDQSVWNDYDACPYGCTNGIDGGTGGAPSLTTGKGGSDVAYDASPYTGVIDYEGFLPGADQDGLYIDGGTSAGSPQWAALAADIDQATGHDLGDIRPDLPSWAAQGGLDDVTDGDNRSATYSRGFSARHGSDSPTGYGTPDVGALIGLVAGTRGHGNHPTFSGPHVDPAHRGHLH